MHQMMTLSKKDCQPEDPKFEMLRRSVSEQKIVSQPECQIGNFMLETSEKRSSTKQSFKKSRNSEASKQSDLSFG